MMFYPLSRLIQSLILPPSSLLILVIIGFALIRRNRTLGRLLIASGLVLLYLLSIGPVTESLVGWLEKDFPPIERKRADSAQAIVVLSGGVRDVSWNGAGPEPSETSLEQSSETSLERIVKGVTIHRTRRIPLVIIGGSGDPEKRISEADAMARVAADLGVPRKDMLIESTARNTVESARELKRVFKGNRILLVTSAYHLRRATAIFTKQGFEVIAVPAGFRSERRPISIRSFIPQAGNLYNSSLAISEYVSYALYAAKGDL
jgi:uncharacterized SAM-binding protein YcdF (DUF218 family)